MDRVGDFLRRDAERSAADIADAIEKLEKTIREKKLEPYLHVTPKMPDIKLPDIHLKENIVIELPMRAVVILTVWPVIITLCFFAFVRWLFGGV